jgi:hypothetical protein
MDLLVAIFTRDRRFRNGEFELRDRFAISMAKSEGAKMQRLLIFCCAVVFAAQLEALVTPQSVGSDGRPREGSCTPVSVKTVAGPDTSPVEVIVSADMCEQLLSDREFKYWRTGTLQLRNTGTKAIRAVQVTFEFRYPHIHRQAETSWIDQFLSAGPAKFRAGGTFTRRFDSGLGHQTTSTPFGSTETAYVAAKVGYVEFEDGTSFVGDQAAVESFFNERSGRLDALRSAEAAYTKGGEKEFLQAIQKPTGFPDLDLYFRNLQGIQQHVGTERAVSQVRAMISRGEGNMAQTGH